MKNNAIIRELKKQDKNIFRAVNQVYGIDFEKPFTIAKINGSFTINKVLKEVEKKHNPHNSKIITLTSVSSRGWRAGKLLAVEITGTGAADFEIKHHKAWFEFNTILDDYYSKGDFNTDRKAADKVYIIAQNNDFLGRKWEKCKPDITSRFFKSDKSYGKYIKDKYTKIEYDMTGINFRCDTKCSIDDFIDKSGYITEYKRQDLKRRAEQLRKERKAAAFKETDNTTIIKGLAEQLTALKKSISEQLALATTAEQIKVIEKSLSWYRGLGDCFEQFERIKKHDADKSFSSIGAFNDSVNGLKEKIEDVRKGVA